MAFSSSGRVSAGRRRLSTTAVMDYRDHCTRSAARLITALR